MLAWMYSANCTGKRTGQWDEDGVVEAGYELTCISCFAAKGHQAVLAELTGFVVAGLEDGGTSHGRFGGGDDAEVLAGDAE